MDGIGAGPSSWSRRGALAAGLALAACAAPAPPEFWAWDGAMREASRATDDFLAAYAPLEARFAATAGAPADGPALSEQVRLGVAAVSAYGEALGLYAAGARFAEVRGALDTLSSDAADLAALVGGAAGYLTVRASTGLLVAGLDAAADAMDGARFEAAVAAQAGEAAGFLRSIRAEAAPAMARVGEAAIADRARAARAAGSAVADGAAERAAFRAALDAWTATLAAAEDGLATLEAATTDRSRFLTPDEAFALGADIRARATETSRAARALELLF